MGVDNAIIELDALELPILDGSSLPYIERLNRVGLRRQRAQKAWARILEPVEVIEGSKRIGVYPPEREQFGTEISCSIDFPHPLIGRQSYALELTPERYAREIAPARTFGFTRDFDALRNMGLIRGGSLENALVLDDNGLMNAGGLRFADEFCRHKLLDLIGDLALFGLPIHGRVVAERAGHYMHVALVNRLMRDRSLWEEATVEVAVPAATAVAAAAPIAQPVAATA
jgi:UDP-3-O-[3-hydroxymyristoyl] N-acetylglucosamine deacetylase